MTTAASPLPPHDYTGTCWWCSGPADSRDHRYKASDLRREFSPQEFKDMEVIKRREEIAATVRGPNSNQVKFSDMFCAPCNNTRSQPFDQAYDRLIDWFLAHESSVEATGILALDQAFADWRTGAENALRYFVKHIGGRIAESGFTVPNSFRTFLDRQGEANGLICSFEMNATLAAINELMRHNDPDTAGNLWVGPVTYEADSNGAAQVIRGWWAYHGLQLVWGWRADEPQTWSNLIDRTVQMPITEAKEGRAIRRISRRTSSLPFWRAWYRARTAVGLPLHRK